ncbi:SLC13 family permease [Tunturibacter empetritectus]|uniref:Arsenical pump membrane protein n=1 Tax=Tunturiibacter lichenicola TaxID=2051959 RepID=A0A7W8N524_9BACT|nr:SLC13 family permease [Edaphobacter lichenicola]MBB5345093.1 arsenical pump membrane protein [Edaphobacter lichenicola]
MPSHILLPLIVGVSIVLMLLRPRGIPEVYWIGGGALLLILLQLVPLRLAGKAVAEGSDVYLFLIGMMLLSELAREHGVFDWLSSVAVRGANGSTARLFTLIYGIGTLVTIFMSNDATAVVLTPAILNAVRKAKVRPLPHLFACALIANAASFVLPISNPANLVVFHQGMPPLSRWLLSFGVPSILSIVATYAVMRMVFKKDLAAQIEETVGARPLTGNGKMVLIGLGVVTAVLLTASALNKDLGLPTCLAALAITAAVSIKARSNPLALAKEISWGTIALVAGLFIMVDAVESIGALKFTQAALQWAQRLAPALGAFVTSVAVGIANNLLNNLPLGLIAGGTLQAAHVKGLIANAVMIGVDLGPNLSVTGSLATILWLIALRREKLDVSFWGFLKVGAIAMPIALFVSVGGAVLMHMLFKAF